MRVAFRYPAPPGTRFAPGCFDRQIGKPVRFIDFNRQARQGRLVRYLVDTDGTAVTLTLSMIDHLISHPAKEAP